MFPLVSQTTFSWWNKLEGNSLPYSSAGSTRQATSRTVVSPITIREIEALTFPPATPGHLNFGKFFVQIPPSQGLKAQMPHRRSFWGIKCSNPYPARQRFLALSSRWETRGTSARNRTIFWSRRRPRPGTNKFFLKKTAFDKFKTGLNLRISHNVTTLVENTYSDLKVQALHYANELQTFLAKTLANSLNMLPCISGAVETAVCC